MIDPLMNYNKNIINIWDKSDNNCLFYAVNSGNYNFCKELLKYKQVQKLINERNNAGKTCLFLACDNGFTNIVKLLFKYNADIQIPSSRKKLPLYVATEKGWIDIVKLLLT